MAGTTIVIVSHLRAGRVSTLKHVPDTALLCVEESQAADYKAAHPDAKLLVHPDEVKGLPAKRQWIYEQIGNVFMLDDDVMGVHSLAAQIERAEGEEHRTWKPKWRKGFVENPDAKRYRYSRSVGPEEFGSMIQRLHDTAVDLGLYVYGFLDAASPMQYAPQLPFTLTSYIHGNGMGLVEGSGLWFNTKITMFEDVWMGALNAHFHRICLRDNRLSIQIKATGTNEGGMASVRTQRSILNDHDILYEAFGRKAIVPRRTHEHLGAVFDANLVRFSSPLTGEGGRNG